MKIKGILTERHVKKGASFQIVTEWEDAISNELKISKHEVKNWMYVIVRNLKRFNLSWLFLWVESLRPVKSYYLLFDMEATTYIRFPSFKNVIPIIIDFWLTPKELPSFYKALSNCKLALITSREVYDTLKANGCPIAIAHFPLSIPDKYISSYKSIHDKTYDFVFAGRKDPVFFDYVRKYEKENPQIEYVYKQVEDNSSVYVSNKRGKLPDDYSVRQNYRNLIKNCKIAFYSTPGIDSAKKSANNYNQITPRFLELISSGCLVMARYPDNSDVEFFQLNEISFRVDSYQDFKNHMDLFADQSFVSNHTSKYYSYLQKHSTSARVPLLQKILDVN